LPEFVAHAAKENEAVRFGAREGGGILKRVMERNGSGEERAVAFGVIANREDVIEGLALKFVNMLGAVAGDVDAQFAHDSDCFGTNMAGVGSGAEDLESIARVVA
jgi:hypothetical protein